MSLRRPCRSFRPRLECLESRLVLSTFYVSPLGNDGGSGSSSAPWRTLQRAADSVQAGDTVVARPGSYTGFDLRADGAAGAPITFRADEGARINAPNTRTDRDGINLEGASYVVIENFEVVGMPRAGIRAVGNPWDFSQFVTIRGNETDANGVWGIFTAFSNDLLIEANTTSRSAEQHGIYVSNSSDRPVIRDNLIWGNRLNGIHLNGDESAGDDGLITGAVVENNVIYDNGRDGGSGINADGVQNSRFANNLLYDNHASGISLYRINGAEGSKNNLVVNNTVLLAADSRWALNVQNGSTGNRILNNILYTEHSWRGSIDISADSLPGFISNHNVLMERITTNGGNSVMGLDSWRVLTGQDANSLVAVPGELFVDPANDDFHLATTSAAVDAGTSLAGTETDLDGMARPAGSGWDIGAYERPQGGLEWLFDFGTPTSPVAAGFTGVSQGTAYSAARGYGWRSGALDSRDRGRPDALAGDFVFSTNATFAVDVPNGSYQVTVTMGDVRATHDRMAVSLEGVRRATLTAEIGQFVRRTYAVTVADGQLTLGLSDLGGVDPFVVINGLEIRGSASTTSEKIGPWVASASFIGQSPGQVDAVDLRFSEAIDAASFTSSDVALTGPGGPIGPVQVQRLAADQFRLLFAPQTAAGTYSLALGPQVLDASGNAMDQNRNGTNGEPADRFTSQTVLEQAVESLRLDFGTGSSPLAEGFTRVTPSAVYSPAAGYGWLSGTLTARDRTEGNELVRDFNFARAAEFAVDLSPGTYSIGLTMGDATVGHDQMGVFLEDQQVASVTTAVNQFKTVTFQVDVTDGQLTVRLEDLGGSDRNMVINGLEIEPVASLAATASLAGLAEQSEPADAVLDPAAGQPSGADDIWGEDWLEDLAHLYLEGVGEIDPDDASLALFVDHLEELGLAQA